MTNHTIVDTKSHREFHFDGELIASASTARPGRARWSELQIYRTPTSQYVLVKSGRSIQFHAERSCSGVHAKQVKNTMRRDIDGIPCLKCGPAKNETLYFKENDLVTVIVSKEARGIVESAHLVDEDSITFLPHIAQRLLEDACKVDADIRDAYRVQAVL